MNPRPPRRYYPVMGSPSATLHHAAGGPCPPAGADAAAANPSAYGRESHAAATGEEATVSIEPAAGRDEAERALLARIAEGDRAALTELHRRYARQLFAFLTRLAPDAATAEEITQDTLLAVWRSAGSFAGRSTVRTWIYGIARRQAHNRLRRTGLTLVALDNAPPQPDPAATPEQHALATADRDRLAHLLGQLTLVHREALVLFFLDDLTHAEMAQILDVPIGTVKSRLSNARRALARLAAADQGAPA